MDIIDIASAEVGYLEKASNYQLENKNTNPGFKNYTKYGQWYGMNGQPWCAIFVSWCADQCGELSAVGKYAYVPYLVDFHENLGNYHDKTGYTPKRNDLIIFSDESHVGIVESVNNGYVTVIEGNSSATAGLTPNGGMVARKKYSLKSNYIQGYIVPDYKNGHKTNDIFFQVPKLYKNGSTPEPVYCDSAGLKVIGELNIKETVDCLGIVDGKYMVVYPVDGTTHHKIGFVVYSGGVSI